MKITKEEEKKFALMYENYMKKKREERRKELDEMKKRYVENSKLLEMARSLVGKEEEVEMTFWEKVWDNICWFFTGGYWV